MQKHAKIELKAMRKIMPERAPALRKLSKGQMKPHNGFMAFRCFFDWSNFITEENITLTIMLQTHAQSIPV